MNALCRPPTDKGVDAPTQGQTNPSNRIPYIDDSIAVREANAKVLICSGYHVDVAEDGEAVNSSEQKGNVTMNTITPENSKLHLPCSRWRESSGRLLRSFSRSWPILFALVALASTARASTIVGVTDCTYTNLTIQLSQFPQGPLVVKCGGVILTGTYNYTNQTFCASRPSSLTPGSYLLG